MRLAGLLAMVLLVVLNGVLVAVEVAIAAVDPSRWSGRVRDPSPGARRRGEAVVELLERRGPVVSAAQLGVSLCSLALGVAAVTVLADALAPPLRLDSSPGWAVTVALLVAVIGQLVVGELVPTTFAAARPDTVVSRLARPALVLVGMLGPLTRGLSRLARWVAERLGDRGAPLDPAVRGREELRRLVRDSEADGTISHDDAELLQRTLRLGDKIAADALTPRVAVASLPFDASVGTLLEQSAATGLSRFPVERDGLDDVVGVVHVKDVLGVPAERRAAAPIAGLVRPVLAVPESKPLEDLMVLLRGAAGQFALVVDEYGGTAGIITLEDLLEEVVGEIDDEHDPTRRGPGVRRWAGAHLLSGRLHPDEVADACGFELPDGAYETLGGFVMERLGAIPQVGDRFTAAGWSVEVLSMDGRRVETVRLVAPTPGTFGGGV